MRGCVKEVPAGLGLVQPCPGSLPPCPAVSSPPVSPTTSGPDTQPPTAPGKPLATGTCGVANLVWSASVDNVNIFRYEVWRATGDAADATFQLVATIPTKSYTQNGAGTFQFKVRAFDASSNVSAFGPSVTVYVPACPTPARRPIRGAPRRSTRSAHGLASSRVR
jgi:hypothetical protein